MFLRTLPVVPWRQLPLAGLCCALLAGTVASAQAAPAINATPTAPACTTPPAGMLAVSRDAYHDKLHGFWLGLSIGNWTGLVTEMDKIGGDGPNGRFYTRADWGQPDQPSIWGKGMPSPLSPTITWVLRGPGETWGADDDSDIEYIYQQLLLQSASPLLTGAQIRDGWLRHIYSDRDTPHRNADGQPENFLWVSNQQAFDLMEQGWVPPFTGMPPQNPHSDMIDAQLTTELFGALSPGRPDVAAQLAYLPIRTTASGEAADIAQFYVDLHAQAAVLPASVVTDRAALRTAMLDMAQQARSRLPANQYPAKMFDFVLAQYRAGVPWETARDAVYQRYQVQQADGYEVTARKLYCNGCFAAGINFAASLLSYFYGDGDMRETLKIAVLAGWDSDNPTATWGGLFGLMLGKAGVTQQFGRPLSSRFDIHRTRKGFPNDGKTDFDAMARDGVAVIDKVVPQVMKGRRSADGRCWLIPQPPRAPQPTP